MAILGTLFQNSGEDPGAICVTKAKFREYLTMICYSEQNQQLSCNIQVKVNIMFSLTWAHYSNSVCEPCNSTQTIMEINLRMSGLDQKS